MNNQDPRYQRLLPILSSPAQEISIIFGRGSGKSYGTKYWILEQIEKQGKEFIWLRRQFDSIRTGSLESWKRVINSYCRDNNVQEGDIELVWDAITRGIKYQGIMKCFMVELFSSYKARENYTQTISHIIFDEAIINPQTGEAYLADEEEKIKELLGSAWRDRENDPKPKLIYIANPYERFRGFLREFLPVIRKQRNKLLAQVLANELVRLGVGKQELYLLKNTACLKVCECELENCLELWQGFFAKEEDLRMCEFVNGSRALFVFNGCVFYLAKEGYWFFVSLESKEISNKENLPWVKEYCLTYEKRLKSKQKVKWDYSEELLRSDLLGKWERGKLRFVDGESRERMMEFMGRGRVRQNW